MEIFLENSEACLKNEINKAKQQNIIYRCLHIKISKLNSFNLDLLKIDLHDALSFHKAKLFLCSDSDVFLITQGIPIKKFRNIQKNIVPHSLGKECPEGVIEEIDIFNNSQCILKLLEEKQSQIKKEKPDNIEFREKKQRFSLEEFTKLDADKIQQRRIKRKHLNILVIDDAPVITCPVKNVVEKKYPLSEKEDIVIFNSAPNAQKGISEYIIQSPDVLFLDIGLPDKDGKEVLNKVLSVDPYAYVVMLSGQSSRNNVVQCIQQGAVGFIGKPFNIDQLLYYIAQCPREMSPRIKDLLAGISASKKNTDGYKAY